MSKKVAAFGVQPNSRKYRLRLARYAALAETLADYVKLRLDEKVGPVRVLDAGLGNGKVLRYLEPYGITREIEFHGIDNSPERIKSVYAAERYQKITCGDLAQRLDYPDNTFDTVVCEQVLEHIDEPKDVLKELARVLRPQGLLIVGVPTFCSVLALLRRHIISKIDLLLGKRRNHVQVFTTREITELIQQTPDIQVKNVRGFRIVSGGILAPLENYHWWYILNRKIGQLVPGLCVETQVIGVKVPQEKSDIPT